MDFRGEMDESLACNTICTKPVLDDSKLCDCTPSGLTLLGDMAARIHVFAKSHAAEHERRRAERVTVIGG